MRAAEGKRSVRVGDRVTLVVDRDVPADDRPRFLVTDVVSQTFAPNLDRDVTLYRVLGNARAGYVTLVVADWVIDDPTPPGAATLANRPPDDGSDAFTEDFGQGGVMNIVNGVR